MGYYFNKVVILFVLRFSFARYHRKNRFLLYACVGIKEYQIIILGYTKIGESVVRLVQKKIIRQHE